jgi:hypothetical protein
MSRRKRGGAADQIYGTHLNGGQFQFNSAVNRESMIENMYIRILSELAMNRFKWTGLPKSVNARFLEMTLFYQALAVFFDDERFGYLALKGSGQNYLNYQNDPTGFMVVGNNYYHPPMGANKVVPIWANYMRMPDVDIVMIYANRLANFDRTLEINSMNARRTKVLAYPENLRLTVENINRQMDEGQDAIKVTGAMGDMEFMSAIDLGIDPDTIEKLDIVRARQWNVCMGLLGIDFGNQDKKERLVSDEVNANNEQTDNMKFVNLNARRQACEEINEKFGLDVSVDYNTEIAERAEMLFQTAIGTEFKDNV